jgi:hypothetical protein
VKSYLKILFSAVFITALAAIPAQAQQAAPAQAAPAQAAPAQATTPAAQQAAPTAATTAPEQAPPPETPVAATRSYYNYAHNESEYSVKLPEAPTVRTIWLEGPDTEPYMKYPPNDDAALGEVATFRRVDIDTEETFDVKITFIRARPSFLKGLNEKRLKNMLSKQYSDITMTNENFTMSQGTGTLKWATFSGFALDAHNHPAFCAIHYLSGQQSILVVQVMYSIENKAFQEYYDHLVNSITYVAP